MCEKKILYQPSAQPLVRLTARGRGEKLNFRQICYTTSCLTAYANYREIPISSAVAELKKKGALSGIYRAARKSVLEPSDKVAAKLIRDSKGV